MAEQPGPLMSPVGQMKSPPKLQSSFSANDVPTAKNSAVGVNTNSHAQQHLHNHNASMGRIPAGAMQNRHSRELSADKINAAGVFSEQNNHFASLGSTLQGGAHPFTTGTSAPGPSSNPAFAPAPGLQHMPAAPYAGGFYPQNYSNPAPVNGAMNYGVNGMLAGQMGGLNINSQPVFQPQSPYQPQQYVNGNGNGNGYITSPPPVRDSQARVMQSRRVQDNNERKSCFLPPSLWYAPDRRPRQI